MNRYLIANWKMNVPPEGIGAYLDALGGAAGGAALVVAPPYVYVKDVVARAPRNVGGIASRDGGPCRDGYVTIGQRPRRHL